MTTPTFSPGGLKTAATNSSEKPRVITWVSSSKVLNPLLCPWKKTEFAKTVFNRLTKEHFHSSEQILLILGTKHLVEVSRD